MSLVLYDLQAGDGRAFSPFCWRIRMALAHKGLTPQLRRVRFSDIARIGHDARTVPVLLDGERAVLDSWDIALYLDEHYPNAPSLFPTVGDQRMAAFVHQWVVTQLHLPLFHLLAFDIWRALDPEDQPYFRASREKRLGAPLESVKATQAESLQRVRANVAPLRLLLDRQPFLGGQQPVYADHIVFGAFQWARAIGRTDLLEGQDSVAAWFERCLDLYGGVGRRR